MDALLKITAALQESGPYFMTVCLGFAYWHKTAYVRKLHQQMMDMVKQQTEVMQQSKYALDSLKDLLKIYLAN